MKTAPIESHFRLPSLRSLFARAGRFLADLTVNAVQDDMWRERDRDFYRRNPDETDPPGRKQ